VATLAQLDGFIDLLVDAVLRELDDPTKKNGPHPSQEMSEPSEEIPDAEDIRNTPDAPQVRGLRRSVCSDPRAETLPGLR
jgi:hypothetical protein